MIKEETMKMIKEFMKARDWDKFHTDCNLAKSLVLEASEVLELFQWSEDLTDEEGLKEELADVLVYVLLLCDNHHLDIDEIIKSKMEKNALKYPVEKSYGKSTKYNKLN